MKFQISLLAAAVSALLTACGGGGDSPIAETPKNTATVSENVASTVSALGATTIAGLASNEVAYDLVAAVGDTWRLIINTSTNKARVVIIQTDYALTDTTEVTVVKTTSGNNETWAGTGINVTVDIRTKNATGTVTVGAITSAVAGTGYAVSDFTKVAGDYAWAGRTANPDGKSPGVAAGTLRVAANGTDVILCDSGVIDANGDCQSVGGSNPVKVVMALDSVGKLTVPAQSNAKVGFVRVVPGDLGPILLIDRSGDRVGMYAAHKLAALAGKEFNGTWKCTQGQTFVVSDTTVTNTSATPNQTGSLGYNQIGVTGASGRPALNGVIATYDAYGAYDTILPLSSSFVVAVGHEDNSINACHRNS